MFNRSFLLPSTLESIFFFLSSLKVFPRKNAREEQPSDKRPFPISSIFFADIVLGIVMAGGNYWIHESTIICCGISLNLIEVTLIPLINVRRRNKIFGNGLAQPSKVFNYNFPLSNVNTNFFQRPNTFRFPLISNRIAIKITPSKAHYP